MTTLRVTVFRSPNADDPLPWCWQTENGHGQALTPNAAVAAGHEAEAVRAEAAANSLAVELADMRAKAKKLRAMVPVNVPSEIPL